jgi:hypothetical protein
VLLVALATAAAIGLAAPPAAGEDNSPDHADPPDPASVERRELLVIDLDGKALDGGSGSTEFGVVLEGDDECPGDSQHDQYRIDSYMVPVDVDPTQLTYGHFGPTQPSFRDYAGFQMPLYKVDRDAFGGELTGEQVEPGGPGPIHGLPAFT